MKDFIIFSLLVALVSVPAAIFVIKLIFKKSINFQFGMLMCLQSGWVAILAYAVATFGILHLIWGTILAVGGIYLIINHFQNIVSRPLKGLIQNIETVSDGDLNVVISEKLQKKTDELGEVARALDNMIKNLKISVNIAGLVSKGKIYSALKESEKNTTNGDLDNAIKNMITRLKEIVIEINQSAMTLSGGSVEIGANSQRVSGGASQQASSIEEVSSSMEEILSSINQNADNANETEKIARKAAEDIDIANQASENLINSTKTISEKILIINELASKTDMLAINAAIEAARAGINGKGFAVVAVEIRKLAEKSHQAAQEIINLTLKNVKQVENSGMLLQNVIPNINKTANLVQEISAASNEQRNGAEQINNAIVQLNQVTQENAVSAEELAASSDMFINLAEKLKSSVSFFKLDQTQEQRSKDELIKKLKSLISENDEFEKTIEINPKKENYFTKNSNETSQIVEDKKFKKLDNLDTEFEKNEMDY